MMPSEQVEIGCSPNFIAQSSYTVTKVGPSHAVVTRMYHFFIFIFAHSSFCASSFYNNCTCYPFRIC